MKAENPGHYTGAFYAGHVAGALTSATVILGMLQEYHRPRSVIDIGCGRGAWLRAAELLGAQELKGLDGAWVQPAALLSDKIDYESVELSVAMPRLEKVYELCISLEVAEHLAPEKAEDFVALLCRASPAVLFSAAIKHQGGTHHVNERPQSYWAKLFAARGYRCFDVFRGPLWDNPSVDWWYRQNIVLYVEQENELAQRMSRLSAPQPIMDAVHPVAYENLMCLIQRPSFRFCLGCMKRWTQTWIRQIGGGHS